MIVPLLTRRAYDYSSATMGATDLVLARYLHVVAFRSGSLLVRVHAVNVTPGALLQVMAFRTSPSPDAPDVDFVQTTALATADVHSAAAKALIRQTLSTKFGSHIRVVLRVTPLGSASPITATLSVAMLLLETP